MVVADTGPLNYLLWIDHAAVLPALYGRVLIPEGVLAELRDPRAPEPVRRWMATPPGWLHVRPVHESAQDLRHLGLGEREAISLALQVGISTVLMDDAEAREAATARSLATVRTLAVLARGAEQGLVDLEDALDRLRLTTFRARPEHYQAVLDRHRSRR